MQKDLSNFYKNAATLVSVLLIASCSEQAPEQVTAQETNEMEQQLTTDTGFLEENRNRDGVEVTPSGLQYEVLVEGTGDNPSSTDRVTVHYEGTLTDGTVFDSSYQRGQPIDFGLNQVIRGWTEGVQLMKEGATYKFFIPSELAYGARGTPGGPIGPDEDLIFTVELIRVN